MQIVDKGTGEPVVLVPGIQGRWEWMAPAVDAVAGRARAITFSLADEPSSGGRFDERAGFASYLAQIGEALDQCGLPRATICGVSYGGLIAALFAARYPERCTAVVVASGIPPSWRPDARARFLMRAPRLLSPVFCAGSLRLFPEIVAARGGVIGGFGFALPHLVTVLRSFFRPRLMARRVRLLDGLALASEIARVRVPALVITGDEGLDRVVSERATREYLELWPHAASATLAHTGHLGAITRAEEFAGLVAGFARRAADHEEQRRRVV